MSRGCRDEQNNTQTSGGTPESETGPHSLPSWKEAQLPHQQLLKERTFRNCLPDLCCHPHRLQEAKCVLYKASPNFSLACLFFFFNEKTNHKKPQEIPWLDLRSLQGGQMWLNPDQIKMFTDSLINKWAPLDVTLMNGASRCFH